MKLQEVEKLSLKELKALKAKVESAIVSFEERRLKAARAELEEHAKSMGFKLSQLVGAATPRKRSPAKPKYANPANRSETWSGRGRKPRWVVTALSAGKSLDDLTI